MNKRSLKVIIIEKEDSERLAIKRTIGLCFHYLPNISECTSLEEAELLQQNKGKDPQSIDLVILDCGLLPPGASFSHWVQQMKSRFGSSLLLYCNRHLDDFDLHTLRAKKIPYFGRSDLTPDLLRERIESR
jgi:hypothetical protein